MHFLLCCNPENRRSIAFTDVLRAMNPHTYSVIAYEELLSQSVRLEEHVRQNTIVKIESPGENVKVRQGLIEYEAVSSAVINQAYLNDFGRIAYQDEWYEGFCRFLNNLHSQFTPFDVRFMNDTECISTMFDKVATKSILMRNDIPSPPSLDPVTDFATLVSQMEARRIRNVFIKPAHGSSASGVVALRTNGKNYRAISSIELVRSKEGTALYNSLKVRTYDDKATVTELVNIILKGKVSIEQWIPKAAFNGSAFDFRVITINGKARHIVARTSKSPITNLHLGNKRGDLSAITDYIGSQNLKAIRTIAEDTAKCFPSCLYMGVDVLISADLRRVMVLEVNAFGDLLPNLTDAGESVYEAQIKASIQKWSI